MRLLFLGTGTSFGVPMLGCGCAVCRSPDPRDRRTRVGALVETDGGTRILIDTPPELRLQLIAGGIDRVDAVLFTHDHADHTHGIDDLRAITVRRAAPLTVYGSEETLGALTRKFDYIFDPAVQARPGSSKPEGEARAVQPGKPFRIGDVEGGVPLADWDAAKSGFAAARAKVAALRARGALGFLELPGDRKLADSVTTYARAAEGKFDDVVILGIGGSALGPIAMRSALLA